MSERHPRGLPYIVGNEAAERFSYYGMKSILVVLMTTYLLGRTGELHVMQEREAVYWYHIFGMANYVVPLAGAILADAFLGKYKTIILLSCVYCLGHLALALDSTRVGLAVGLALIAIGAGGIKPCVSAHLGDQYQNGARKISEGYSLFYIAINIGAFLSTLLTPWLLQVYGPHLAFGLPGVLMGIATIVFWKGRRHYVVQPPTPWREYRKRLWSIEHRGTLGRLACVFALLSVFWALFDQTGSSWVFQAEKLNLTVALPLVGSLRVLPSQVQALNPILILLITPLFTWVVYPRLVARQWVSTRGRVVVGMVLAALSFGVVGYTQTLIDNGVQPSVLWQVGAYIILTIAEVLVSITTLELAYTHAPEASRSFVTSFYLLSVSLGNLLTALVVGPLKNAVPGPTTPQFFFLFAALSLVVAPPIWGVLGKRKVGGALGIR